MTTWSSLSAMTPPPIATDRAPRACADAPIATAPVLNLEDPPIPTPLSPAVGMYCPASAPIATIPDCVVAATGDCKALNPIAVLYEPLVREYCAPRPIAMLKDPVVNDICAYDPIAELNSPLVRLRCAETPNASLL